MVHGLSIGILLQGGVETEAKVLGGSSSKDFAGNKVDGYTGISSNSNFGGNCEGNIVTGVIRRTTATVLETVDKSSISRDNAGEVAENIIITGDVASGGWKKVVLEVEGWILNFIKN